MKTDQQQEGPVTVLALSGPMVEEELGAFSALLGNLMQQGKRRVLLDLSAVLFVDSAAMELLLDASSELAGAGGALKIGGVSDVVSDAFAATRLASHVEIHKDRTTARRAFL